MNEEYIILNYLDICKDFGQGEEKFHEIIATLANVYDG